MCFVRRLIIKTLNYQSLLRCTLVFQRVAVHVPWVAIGLCNYIAMRMPVAETCTRDDSHYIVSISCTVHANEHVYNANAESIVCVALLCTLPL